MVAQSRAGPGAGVTPTDPSLDDLVDAASARAARLLEEAERRRTRAERAARRRFAGLLRDPAALAVTITLTDEVMRSASVSGRRRHPAPGRTSRDRARIRRTNAAGLRLAAASSRLAPRATLGVVHARVRALTRDLIVDAAPAQFARHARARARAGLALNVNVLGEAVLGEGEADGPPGPHPRDDGAARGRLRVGQALRGGEPIHDDRRRGLPRAGRRATAHDLSRRPARDNVFVNLDMEEYRDLRLTLGAFTSVLAEDEFARPARRDRPAGLPARVTRRARGAPRLGRCAPRARRRRGQGPPRQGRQPGDGARRGRAARLAGRPLRHQGRRRRQLRCGCSTSRCAIARAGALRVGVAEPQPLRPGLGPRGRRAPRGRRHARRGDARGDGQRRGRGAGAATGGASCSTRRSRAATTSPRPSPTSCDASTRTPRRRTTCARPSTSRAAPRPSRSSAGASRPR